MEHRHLFIDLHHITRIEGLCRRLHQPKRHAELDVKPNPGGKR